MARPDNLNRMNRLDCRNNNSGINTIFQKLYLFCAWNDASACQYPKGSLSFFACSFCDTEKLRNKKSPEDGWDQDVFLRAGFRVILRVESLAITHTIHTCTQRIVYSPQAHNYYFVLVLIRSMLRLLVSVAHRTNNTNTNNPYKPPAD